jgi:multisubunit Na+/H+ antiporter MnhE subunit
MSRMITFAIPSTLFWMTLTDQWNIEGAIIGVLISIAVLLMSNAHRGNPIDPAKLPGQVISQIGRASCRERV